MSSANGGRTTTMSELVRSSGSGEGGEGTRTRILLVRQPPRSVRPGDAPNPLPMRLAIGVVTGIGTVIVAWIIGTLGMRLGFAPLVHLPGMEIALTDGLTASVLMAVSVPATIIRTGIEHPLLMMLCYGLIALPAASLAGVRVATPGGPKPHVLSQMFSYSVAVLGAIHACLLVWWAASSFRADLIAPLALVAGEVGEWFTSMRVAAGLDVLAFIIAALWVVLIMRVAIPTWLRALCAPAAIAALVVITIAMSITNATVAHVQTPRTAIMDENGASEVLMLGDVGGQSAIMSRAGDQIVIELRSPQVTAHVTGRRSIIEFAGGR